MGTISLKWRLEGIIDAPKSGRWGGWEYCMRGKTNYCRRHPERKDPGTPPQRRVRLGLSGVKDLSELVPMKAEAVSGESVRLGARVALNGSTQLPKLQELNKG